MQNSVIFIFFTMALKQKQYNRHLPTFRMILYFSVPSLLL